MVEDKQSSFQNEDSETAHLFVSQFQGILENIETNNISMKELLMELFISRMKSTIRSKFEEFVAPNIDPDITPSFETLTHFVDRQNRIWDSTSAKSTQSKTAQGGKKLTTRTFVTNSTTQPTGNEKCLICKTTGQHDTVNCSKITKSSNSREVLRLNRICFTCKGHEFG